MVVQFAAEKTQMTTGSPTSTDANPSRLFSILVGRVSTEDSGRILELLDALQAQESAPAYEVILADRRQDGVSACIRAKFPEVQLLSCPPGTSLPELRTLAFDKSRGDYIVVTEDHCVPSKRWLAGMVEAFRTAPAETVAVGGSVENGVCETALDWATFLCEYSSFVGPVRSGPVPSSSVPGMNVAYRRSAIAEIDRAVLTRGFWETTVHPLLAEQGLSFYLSDGIRILHKKKFSLRLFATQRFLYSRYYAGIRFGPDQTAARLAMCALTVALPPVLLFRMTKNIIAKKRLFPELIRALPHLTLFALIWAYGEAVGYMFGPGDALSRIE
jgi:hypothetical protein